MTEGMSRLEGVIGRREDSIEHVSPANHHARRHSARQIQLLIFLTDLITEIIRP